MQGDILHELLKPIFREKYGEKISKYRLLNLLLQHEPFYNYSNTQADLTGPLSDTLNSSY